LLAFDQDRELVFDPAQPHLDIHDSTSRPSVD
jgi:hypothetical protein